MTNKAWKKLQNLQQCDQQVLRIYIQKTQKQIKWTNKQTKHEKKLSQIANRCDRQVLGSKMQNISTSSNKYRLFSSSSFFYNLFLLWVHSGPNPVTSLALEIVKGTDWWSLPTGTRVTIAARGIGLASIAMRGWIESAKWPRKKTFNLS